MRLNHVHFMEHPLFGTQKIDLSGGRFFGVCGKNGIGKTTFLESLGFRMRPSAYGGGKFPLRKPFLKSRIDFNEEHPFRMSQIPDFGYSVNFFIDAADHRVLVRRASVDFLKNEISDFELISSDEFLGGSYDLYLKNELYPGDQIIDFIPVMRKKISRSFLYARVSHLSEFYYCIDINSSLFEGMDDWNEWSSKNIVALGAISAKANLLRNRGLPALLQPVLDFLENFNTAWDGLVSQITDPCVEIDKIRCGISGIQDAFLREFSRGQLRMLLTLIEIEKFNKSSAIFLALEEPEQNFDPIAQRFLISLYESMIKPGAQIFLTTHSPYLLSFLSGQLSEDSSRRIFVLNDVGESVDIVTCLDEWGAADALPQVFDLYTEDVFLRLYSRAISKFLPMVQKGAGRALGVLIKDKLPEVEMRNDPRDGYVPLPIFVRNAIHHPENTERSYSDIDLKNSVEKLMRLLSSNP
jgi:predicted ATPase